MTDQNIFKNLIIRGYSQLYDNLDTNLNLIALIRTISTFEYKPLQLNLYLSETMFGKLGLK